MLTTMILLVSFSTVKAKTCDNFGPSLKQEFAGNAAASGLDQATAEALANGKSVIEIICVALAADFGDHAIITALVKANTGQTEIISAAYEAGLNIQIATAALGGSNPGTGVQQGELGHSQAEANQSLNHPYSPLAGGAIIPASVSPSTF